MKKSLAIGMIAAGILAIAGPFASADEYSKNLPKVAKALSQASVPLDQGIKASEAQGKPISAQYEIDEGHFQLSVFTKKGEDLLEIIVDYKTGAIKTVQNISDPDDIKDAKKQIKAMAKASIPLDQAVAAATKANDGYRAVQVIPKLSGGQPVAAIVLVKGDDIKKVTQKLD